VNRLYWVYDHELAGRAGPARHPWDVQRIMHAGIRAVLSIDAAPIDTSELTSAGILHHCLPFPDAVPPTADTELRCRSALPDALEYISANVREARPVLVHCFAGKDRTGLVLAAFVAQRDSLSPEGAIARVRAAQPKILTAVGWEALAVRIIGQMRATQESR
jgi:protein-tyrosine phosphatase